MIRRNQGRSLKGKVRGRRTYGCSQSRREVHLQVSLHIVEYWDKDE
jgi:hypothetical protein